MRKWWIGCSGFYYKGWRGKFYPDKLPQSKWFEFYCQYFNTVELNISFYRFPKLSELKGWFKRSPDEFKFTVKAPRLITHYKKFHNCKRETNDFYNLAATGLGEKLGSILFQLHPRIVYREETLQRILDTVDRTYVNVIEFRHESWWTKKVYDTLKENNIVFCGISYPSLPDDVVKTAPSLYYRFHGVPQLYLSSYAPKRLTQVSEKIKSYRGLEDIYCYFNNDIKVAAVSNAKALKKLVDHSR